MIKSQKCVVVFWDTVYMWVAYIHGFYTALFLFDIPSVGQTNEMQWALILIPMVFTYTSLLLIHWIIYLLNSLVNIKLTTTNLQKLYV